MFAAVVVNKKTKALDRIFYYEIPNDLPVGNGMIVQVDFNNQKLEAFVVEVCADVDFDKTKIKPIEKIITPQPQRRYRSPLVAVLQKRFTRLNVFRKELLAMYLTILNSCVLHTMVKRNALPKLLR